jgi:nicotinamidase-related amidase
MLKTSDVSNESQHCQTCIQAGGSSGVLASSLVPTDAHYRVLKPKQSAFFLTTLKALLDTLEVNALFITGVATDACVLCTALIVIKRTSSRKALMRSPTL